MIEQLTESERRGTALKLAAGDKEVVDVIPQPPIEVVAEAVLQVLDLGLVVEPLHARGKVGETSA